MASINDYLAADEALKAAEETVAAAKAARDKVACVLVAECGKGPYQVDGCELFLNGGKGGSIFLSRKRGRKAKAAPVVEAEAGPAAEEAN